MQEEGGGGRAQGLARQPFPLVLGQRSAFEAAAAPAASAAAAAAAGAPSPGGASPAVQCAQRPAPDRPSTPRSATTPVQCAQAQPALRSPAPGGPARALEPVQALGLPGGSAARPGQAGAAAHQLPLACDLVRLHTHQWAGAAQAGSAATGQEPDQAHGLPAPRADAGQGDAAAAAEQPAAAVGQPARSLEAAPLVAEAGDALEGEPLDLDSGSDSDSSASEDGYRVGSRRRLAWQPAALPAAAAQELRASQLGSQRCGCLA